MSQQQKRERLLNTHMGYKDSGLDLDLAAILSDCEMRGLAAKTLETYRYRLAAFQTWAANMPANRVTPQDLLRPQAQRAAARACYAFCIMRVTKRWAGKMKPCLAVGGLTASMRMP